MSWHGYAAHELAHIEAAIGLLEKTRKEFASNTVVCDPAYWRLRLNTIRVRLGEDRTLERQMSELLVRVDRLEARNLRQERADAPM
ncbi:hypothetical protein BTRA_2767 [Burkholderia thailandensis USAMRU Malaysia |uniref:hypothetical protein n=1 Tax=Burkholderia thailandensis TaxID=57975 RepID=UPI0003ECA625|nr:hypothetical protein [Burkholderia thailandensis]AHI77277.1 hypothetical protein BTJ_1175 [Burkholderia thailandensis E444]AIC86753.1 hypothetical protein BTRA_2767 [Burkholderia thailandensis USAMRU Malaysia \